ncbi:MAG TPA: SRPBCC domain-containing protein [Streptosporangiaceae bacterium]|jgi:uncharacterized protein YndB with AHSA1/START domain
MTWQLELQRTVPGSPDAVWQALTSPVALAEWFWPPRLRPAAEVDLRPGGRYRITGPGAGIAISGLYSAVDPPRLLAFSWQWDGEQEQTAVMMLLAMAAAGTDISVRHDGFGSETARDEHIEGWSDCLGRLPGWLAGRQPPAA